jgi:competence protein ComEA
MLLLTALLLTATAASATNNGSDLPPGEGKPIVQRMCTSCHVLKVVTSKRASPDQWAQLVDQMVSRGAEGTDDEIETVVEYLSKNFSLDTPPASDDKKTPAVSSVNINTANADTLGSELGLSPTEANAIISFRQQNGKFQDWQQVANVPGVDSAKIEKAKNRITF